MTEAAQRILLALAAWFVATGLFVIGGVLLSVTEVPLPLRVGIVALAGVTYLSGLLALAEGAMNIFLAAKSRMIRR